MTAEPTPPPVSAALLGAGYRLMDHARGVWGKPMGFSLLTFEAETGIWTQWMRSLPDGRVLIRGQTTLTPNDHDVGVFLAFCETFHYHQALGAERHFHFFGHAGWCGSSWPPGVRVGEILELLK